MLRFDVLMLKFKLLSFPRSGFFVNFFLRLADAVCMSFGIFTDVLVAGNFQNGFYLGNGNHRRHTGEDQVTERRTSPMYR
jgi:hypothetical protein